MRYARKVEVTQMNNFPRKMKTSPIPATSPNFAGFRRTMKKASFAEVQKLFPCMAIFLKFIVFKKNNVELLEYKHFC